MKFRKFRFLLHLVVALMWQAAGAEPLPSTSRAGRACSTEGLMCKDCNTLVRCTSEGDRFIETVEEICDENVPCDETTLSCNHEGKCRYSPFECPSTNTDDVFVFPDPYSCTQYHECKNGQLKDHICPEGTAFDLTTLTCDQIFLTEICYNYPVRICSTEGDKISSVLSKDMMFHYRCIVNNKIPNVIYPKLEMDGNQNPLAETMPTSTTEPSTTPSKESSTTTELSTTPKEESSTTTELSTTPKEESSTTTELSTTPKEESSTTTELNTTPREESSTTTELSTKPKEESSTTTELSTTPKEESSTFTELSTESSKPSSITTELSTTPKEESSTTTESSTTPKEESSTTTESSTTPSEEVSTTTEPSTTPSKEPSTTTEPSTTPKEFECTEEGFFEDVDDCHSFYVCYPLSTGGYGKVHRRCRRGSHFDPNLKRCMRGECGTIITTKSPETGSTTPAPPYNCTSDGYFPDPNDCYSFYVCYPLPNGGYEQRHLRCKKGSHFNANMKRCIQGECETSATTMQSTTLTKTTLTTSTTTAKMISTSTPSESTTESTTPTTPSTISTTTITKTARPTAQTYPCSSEGYFPDLQDCHSFFVCYPLSYGGYGQKHQKCRKRSHFDPNRHRCVRGECTNPF